jgi:endoglucanase Acf2
MPQTDQRRDPTMKRIAWMTDVHSNFLTPAGPDASGYGDSIADRQDAWKGTIFSVGCWLLLAAGTSLLSQTGRAQDMSPEVVSVGAGGYRLVLPVGAREPEVLPFVTSNATGAVPTNDWWSSLVFLPYSNQMFAHPLAMQAHENGLRIYDPGVGYTANPGGIFTAVMQQPNDFTIGHAAEAKFPEARADGWSDWFVTAAFAAGDSRLRLTFGHGSPFVFGTIQGGDPTFTFGNAPTIAFGDAGSPTLVVSLAGRHYGLFGPSGAQWQGLDSNQLTCRLNGKSYFSVALLPDPTDATRQRFERYAHNHVVGSQVHWAYDEGLSRVTTRYEFRTQSHEGQEPGTIFALYPHQTRRCVTPLTTGTYQTVRGIMQVGTGTHFTTVTPFQGILPALPNHGTHDRATLNRYLAADAKGFRPPTGDTYWCGKAMGKLATLASIADAHGNQGTSQTFRERLKRLLEDYLTADSDADGKLTGTRGLFYYNRPWGTLIGYPASYGSDVSLNDHHFHYGYMIRAAAEIARLEPRWAATDRWGGMVELLIRDCANPDRGDPLLPFLRNFDIYAGHSWADGKADFGDGNNQESSSEAMNAWTGMILWGQATGNRRIRDAGIYLYATEKDAIDQYWFDVYDQYPREFDKPMVSMIWGGKAVWATWFSADPLWMHAINYLPIQSGSFYLGTDPQYVRRNFEGLAALKGGTRWKAPGDLVQMYRALYDPRGALGDVDLDTQDIEPGNSRAHLYQWLHFLNQVGQVDASVTADTPLYGVFRKGDERTYVVYHATDKPRTVTFSDGQRITMDRAGFAVVPSSAH